MASREAAVDDLEVVDTDLGLAFGMASVEVRMPMVVEEHRDHDTEEAADGRHPAIMRLPPDTTSRSYGSVARDEPRKRPNRR